MCITRDGKYCPLLSRAEERAQHNFEERKGPYPSALVERLHNDGIMTPEEHFRESLFRRAENVEGQVFHAHFSVSMDCSAEERNYMLGNRHDLPMDIFLPAELAEKMLENFTKARKERFRKFMHNYRELEDAAFLFAYPEFDEWFAEFCVDLRSHSRNLCRLADGLLDKPDLLEKLSGIVSESVLRTLVARLFHRLFVRSTSSQDSRFVDAVSEGIPESHRVRFEQIRYSWNLVTGDTKDIPSTRVRRQRRALKQKLQQWTRLLQDDKSIARNCVECLMFRILDVRGQKASEENLSLAA